MTKISTILAGTLVVIAVVIGIGIGYSLTPGYRSTMYDKTGMDLGKPDRWLDLRYIDSMIAHHRGAMLVAEQALISRRPEIKNLAVDILKNEPKAIAELYEWKKEWYGNTRQVRDPQVPRLGSYDDKFDLRFLNIVIAHHESGVEIVREVKTKSGRLEILNNADAVDTFLSGGIEMLKSWRRNWYNI